MHETHMIEKVRLLVLTTSFPLTRESVSGVFVSRLIEHLPSNQICTTVLTPADCTTTKLVLRKRLTIYPFRYAPRSWQVIAHTPGGIPAALKRNKWLYLLIPAFLLSMLLTTIRLAWRSDVIHANWAICGCVSGIVGKVMNIPVVTSLRGDDITRARKMSIDRFILYFCMRLSKKIIAVSHSMQEWLNQQFPWAATKIVLVENGVETSLLNIARKNVGRRHSSSLRILTIGSLISRKGIDQIIRALGNSERGRKLSLKIVGRGPEEDRLKEMVIACGLGDRVKFSGEVPSNKIGVLLENSDIFILASHSEGRPNVILEAMAAARAIIATNISGTNELIRHNETGLLFEENDINGLTGYIDMLADDAELRDRLGKAARNFIIDKGLLWENTAEQYQKIYFSSIQA